MNYQPIQVNSALHLLRRKNPYGYDLNLYRGCEHGCKYCYAIYSHDYLQDGNFFDAIYYKENILEQLEKELSSPKWKREIVNLGGVTDSYQPIEEKLGLMRGVLKLMIKYRTPVIISTKSTLVLRDLDLIDELSKITYVNVAFTITTMDEELRSHLEPHGSPSQERFRALQELKQTNASLGVHLMPIIPYLTDTESNLEAIYQMAQQVGVDYVLPGTLYLRGKTKPYFLNFLRHYDYECYQKICALCQYGVVPKAYKTHLYAFIHSLQERYQLTSNYRLAMDAKLH